MRLFGIFYRYFSYKFILLQKQSSFGMLVFIWLFWRILETWNSIQIDPIFIAATKDEMGVSSSLTETSAIGNEISHKHMKSSSGHCEAFLCSRSIASRRKEGHENLLFSQLADLFFQFKRLSRPKRILNFFESMDQWCQADGARKRNWKRCYIRWTRHRGSRL